jgi:hypothetical protein
MIKVAYKHILGSTLLLHGTAKRNQAALKLAPVRIKATSRTPLEALSTWKDATSMSR